MKTFNVAEKIIMIRKRNTIQSSSIMVSYKIQTVCKSFAVMITFVEFMNWTRDNGDACFNILSLLFSIFGRRQQTCDLYFIGYYV